MRAEMVLMGKRLDLAARVHRRVLVVSIYAGLAVLMAALWFVDRWHTSGVYMIFATFLVNRFFLGGYNFGGLVKPFNGKAPRRSTYRENADVDAVFSGCAAIWIGADGDCGGGDVTAGDSAVERAGYGRRGLDALVVCAV